MSIDVSLHCPHSFTLEEFSAGFISPFRTLTIQDSDHNRVTIYLGSDACLPSWLSTPCYYEQSE